MPRITVVTNRCNVCGATHRPKAEEDDADRLEDGVEDTELPAYWSEITVRAKQPNPDFAKNEQRVRREVSQQWKIAAQQATQAKGSALDSDDVEGLKEILEKQSRGDEEYPELVVVEAEVLLCPNCTPRLATVGLQLVELSAADTIPPAWVPAAAPAPAMPTPTVVPMVPPPVVVAPVPTPAPQPSPPLAVVPQVVPMSTSTGSPPPAPTSTVTDPPPRAA